MPRNVWPNVKIYMEQRIAERNGTHILYYAEFLCLGTQKYVLITL